MRTKFVLSIIFFVAACNTAIKGTDASLGIKPKDRVVIASDLDLRTGSPGQDKRYKYSRHILNTARSLNVRASYCSLHIASNEAVLSKGTELIVRDYRAAIGETKDKFGDTYKFSQVTLYAFSNHDQTALTLICEPEEVARFGFWRNTESSGRMLTVEEIEELVKPYVQFLDVRRF